jgi:hypothetical protein
MNEQYRVYGYRWVVLAVFMFINLTIQMLWIGYAPITGPAAEFYGVSDLQIGLLAMSFMIAFIPLSIPVSWVIDTYGFRLAVSIGAVLMGVDFIQGEWVAAVRDGKIQSYTYTVSAESLAKLSPAPEGLAETGGGALPSYAWVVTLGSLSVASGLGLQWLRRRSHLRR